MSSLSPLQGIFPTQELNQALLHGRRILNQMSYQGNPISVYAVLAVLSHSVVSNSMTAWTVGCQASLSMGILQARILEEVAMPSSRGSSQPRDQTQVSILQMDSLPSEPPGKLMNSQVGSQSLLQGIFPTQELNSDLLHCRHILYQLSYQGRPEQVWRNTNLSDTTKITPMNSITYSAIIFFFFFSFYKH